MKTLLIPSLEALPAAAAEMLDALGEKRIVAFFGEMGVGKTTFIKALCDALEVTDTTSSPSFGLINEYISEGSPKVYHIDFYRLRDVVEAYDLGYEEYLYSGHYCFLEWPEKIEGLLPEDTVKAYMKVNENGKRIIEMYHLD